MIKKSTVATMANGFMFLMMRAAARKIEFKPKNAISESRDKRKQKDSNEGHEYDGR